ncbi:hypothetical protein O181_016413 [Austropuccinia psidii MF-1]|uniref:Integrase catalytic domain-containing protein n=1 Tax=Austropuccinia psidii MF-1 TaxID=1389203 RepID=A0A9Q3C528_9BASI|nr:hypothetical protein [Austropuccinia psidii MF-1]
MIVLDTGINHIISPPYTPQHNSFSERGNQSVLEKARCILLQSNLPVKYWAEAVSTETFLCNLVQKDNNNMTPHDIWHKSRPPLRYKNGASRYQILRTSDQKIVISKHVLFDKEKFPSSVSQEQNIDEVYNFFPGLMQDMEKNLPDDTDINENNPSIETSSSDDENEDIFIYVLKQQPQRIRVIGPGHPTLISSKINSENILTFSQQQPGANLTNQAHSPPNHLMKQCLA